MTTFFDVVTVTCFVGLVIAFFQFTDRETRTLVHFILAGVVFAVANQLGNAGSTILAIILILAGTTYAVLVARRQTNC
jgi:predicted branched-subunit amino acid permease